MKDVRPSPIAGTWYPGDPEALADSVDQMLARASPVPAEERVVAVIAPHAGHRFSGGVAASAFGLLAGTEPEVVAIVAPFHGPHAATLLTTSHSHYQTPLGEIAVDLAALSRLESELEGIRLDRISQDGEHSLEIELPFLQRALRKPFRILPIMIRDQSSRVARALSRALAVSLRDQTFLLVASSDLSHYRPSEVARQLDSHLLRRIEAFDAEGVLAAEDEGTGYACGKGAIAAILWAARDLGATRARVVAYADSGAVTGDHASVVGYGAAVLTAPRTAEG